MLNDTIEILTKQMIEDHFENKNLVVKMTKTDLYKFCIKLVKLVQEVEKMK